MPEEVAIVLVSSVAIMGAVVLLVASMMNRRHIREMVHRERLAMIERGLVPSPEKNPAAFEAATGLGALPRSTRGERFRTAGVAMIGVGAGLFILIAGLGGVVGIAIGIGGAWVMLGLALLLNYFLMNREAAPAPWAPPPSRDPQPPPGIGGP